MARIRELDADAWAAWVASRPPEVQTLCRLLPPDLLYRMKSTGQRVTILSYAENGTVTVAVTGDFNLVTFDRQVFGINSDDLEECELPDESTPVGTLLTGDAEIEAHINEIRPAILAALGGPQVMGSKLPIKPRNRSYE